MATGQFAQRMPPQQGYGQPAMQSGYSQPPMQPEYGQARGQPHPGPHGNNPHDPLLGGQQQHYYHERMDGKSAGAEQMQERKLQEIQALTFEINQLQQASDPNAAAASIAERMCQQNDPFNEESEWTAKKPDRPCCIIQ